MTDAGSLSAPSVVAPSGLAALTSANADPAAATNTQAIASPPRIIEATVVPGAVATRLDHAVNWFRESSIWYLLFATACCGIELMQSGGPRTDLDRFGAVFRSTPRQADLLIVAGTITYKMADRVRLLYAQMAEPKYVIAMGSCANCGGLFQRSYSVLCGVDQIIPVDLYLPGCPPRPEALSEAILRLQEKMRGERWIDRIKGQHGTP